MACLTVVQFPTVLTLDLIITVGVWAHLDCPGAVGPNTGLCLDVDSQPVATQFRRHTAIMHLPDDRLVTLSTYLQQRLPVCSVSDRCVASFYAALL
jgi:hypothetical protein